MLKNRRQCGGVSRIIAVCIVIMLTFVVMSLCLCACSGASDSDGTVTVVVSASGDVRSYEIDLANIEDGTSAVALLDYLKAEGELDYELSGTFLKRVGHLSERPSEGIYIGVWTSVESDVDVSGFFGEVEYEGQTLAAAGVGITEMHYTDGCIIYFGEMVY